MHRLYLTAHVWLIGAERTSHGSLQTNNWNKLDGRKVDKEIWDIQKKEITGDTHASIGLMDNNEMKKQGLPTMLSVAIRAVS